jgi:hypothetical protein
MFLAAILAQKQLLLLPLQLVLLLLELPLQELRLWRE